MMGSSPLARGLRLDQVHDGAGRGIIPARAGFTSAATTSRGREPDHPRSRGVYATRCVRSQPSAGSSPLARGLRGGGGWQICPRHGSSPLARGLLISDGRAETIRGIIPARAGFTSSSRCHRGGGRDHPRSRGVYAGPDRRPTRAWGSSPLARGLPRRGRNRGHHPGIIPARAGFTPRRASRENRTGDHPRSRGVYRRSSSPAS